MTETLKIPDTLPDTPEGWTKRMTMHLNFGGEGGAASYVIHDETGAPLPITHGYDTRKPGWEGFLINGEDTVFDSWPDIVAAWPSHVARLRGDDSP